MLHVIAIIETHPGARDALLQQMHEIVPLVHAEAGCLDYGPAVDATTGIAAQSPLGEHTVVVVERWADEAALAAHLAAPHMAAYRERVKPLVASVKLHVLRPA